MTDALRAGPGPGEAHDAAGPGVSRRRLPAVLALVGLGIVLGGVEASCQEAVAEDTAAVADTTEEDQEIPGEPTRPPPRFPDALELPDSTAGGLVRRWGREELLDAGAVTLLDFLLDEAPELLQLRAGYYAGPHHLVDGLLGPGFVQVVVDQRTLPPLESAQPDLARISLSRVERIRLLRRPGRTVVEVTTLHHEGGQAYSRIGAGTGQPGADLIHGVFANGFGGSGAVAGGVDYLNIAAGSMPATRLEAWARAAWMPVDNGSGLEVTWRAESVERTAVVASRFDRSELFLHGRANVTDGVQAEFWVGTESRAPDEEGAGEGEGPVDDVEAGATELRVTATGARGWSRGALRLHDDPSYPNLEARMDGGFRAVGPVYLSGTASYGRWEEFETWDAGAELGLREEVLGIGLDAGLGAAAGRRGLSYPASASADSVSFEALEARLTLEAGPYTLVARGTYQDLERVPAFGGRFDRDLAPRGGGLVRAVEGRLQGPLLPLDGVSDLLRVRGTWRHRFVEQGERTLYVPAELIQGELTFVERFFEDNLEIRLGVRVRHRSEMLAPTPGLTEPEILAAETAARGQLVLQINEFRLWWRGGNLRTLEQADFGGLVQPVNRNLFGITWEFRN